MAIEIKNYGTFAGPGSGDGDEDPLLDFDDNEENDPIPQEDPDIIFLNETNIAACLVKSRSDYVRFRCDGTDTDDVHIDKNSGTITSLTLDATTTNTGNIAASGSITATSVTCGGVKCFNIPHPSKEGKRLVYACLEGPENGVYVRGRLKNNNTIELPDYWVDLVDPDSITVQLTPMGTSQDLIVDSINWGRQVVVRSVAGTGIDCFYLVQGTRVDVPPLEVEQDA